MRVDHDSVLKVITRAWGRKQDDEYYCFFPWIDREEQAKEGLRGAGFHDGPAFKWPSDRAKIIAHMNQHLDHDLYWCPSLFEYPERKTENAIDEKALWADLDEVDPRTLEEYEPTVAWETSPGRYQALWILNQGDMRGASWPGNENQRMTYHVGADEGGWDTTQLLRIPGWTNHKLHYKEKYGEFPKGRLLWKNRRYYQADDFSDLPEIEGRAQNVTVDVIASSLDAMDRSKVLAKYKLKIPKRIKELLNAREATGDRSDVLWDIDRSLADIGMTIEEIVLIVRETVWNKYEGRADELKRLIEEASKAIAQRPKEIIEKLEDESEAKGSPTRWSTRFENLQPPKFLVRNVLTKGKVGFVAGQPKSWKSWVALDLALSVATGSKFLDIFDVEDPGPVLYIQEEDDESTVKSRGEKIWRGKNDHRVIVEGGEVFWLPSKDKGSLDPDINVYMQGGVVISEPEWQEWLSHTLEQGMNGEPYRLLVIDTLMMVAGDVEENRAQEMTTKIFKPLKQIARIHGCAIIVVHHMRKGGDDDSRGGQLMLGSVANHAWSEDSMFIRLTKTGELKLEVESKHFPGSTYRVSGLTGSREWLPSLQTWSEPRHEQASHAVAAGQANTMNRSRGRPSPVLELLQEHESLTVGQLAQRLHKTPNQITRTLRRAAQLGKVSQNGHTFTWVKGS